MEAKRGDRVSLDTSKRLFYFQEGIGGINLIAENTEVAIIPENATDHQLAQINHAIKNGQLILGWAEKSVEVADRESDLIKLLESGRNKVEDWMYKIRDDKKIDKSVKIAQIEKIISLENAGKKRKSVILAAEKILSYIGGVSPVEESEQEKIEIKLTSGNSEDPEEK
jgi:hypothetical protein